MKIRIAPSILSADFSRIADAVRTAEAAGADLIHIDIMDGHFVPNLTLGPQIVAALKKQTSLPLDVHLMVEKPRAFIPLFRDAGADWISIHLEASRHLHKDVTSIRELGAKAGLALNPATPLHLMREIIGELDFILLLTVNPGWGGQKFIPSCMMKIRNLKDWIREGKLAAAVEIDGGVNLENFEDLIRAGADIFVAGSSIFRADDPAAVIRRMKAIAAGKGGKRRGA